MIGRRGSSHKPAQITLCAIAGGLVLVLGLAFTHRDGRAGCGSGDGGVKTL